MGEERKYRTYDEVTGDVLVKRLDQSQLLQLVGKDEFRRFQPKILERLQSVNGIGFRDFERVHPTNGCETEEIVTGNDVKVGGTDIDVGRWSDIVPVKKIICNSHDVTSNTFFDYYGQTRDGPFIGDE